MSVQESTCLQADFPKLPPKPVERQHVLDTISQIASDEVPVVFVEGEDGCGATTLLAQFCLAAPEPCFYLFVRPASRFAYSVDYLRLVLAEQFAQFIGRQLTSEAAVDISEYHSLLLAVRKRKGRGVIYFVIDGLQQVPRDNHKKLEAIFNDVLTFGVPGFRFLITGKQDEFEELIHSTRSKTYQVQKLSSSESASLLDGLGIEPKHLADLISLCRGLPGRLASVRRQILAGAPAESILAADQKNYPQFLALEFKSLDALSATQRLIMAVLAYSRYALTSDELKTLCSADEFDIAEISAACPFVVMRNAAPYCTFESETHRRIAESRLEGLRHQALTLQIERLSSNPNSLEALQFLPAYLQQANQLHVLIEMLVPDHYENLLDKTQSVASLRARAALGARSALELKRALQVFQFSLQRSIFYDVAAARGFQAQIGALVALGQSRKALDVASQATTRELRLQMLAEYARRMRESNYEVDSDVVALIKELSSEIDFSTAPEEAERLAENIAFVDPDLAISILNQSAAARDSGSRDRDNTLMKLSVAASVSRVENNSSIVEKTSKQISDERLRSLISFIAGYMGNGTVSEISTIADPMGIERRIYFLRSILAGADSRPAGLDILDYALNQIVGNASYLPKIKDFVDFATPLGLVETDSARTEALTKRIEGQLGLVEESATSGDRVRLQVKLARAEAIYNFDLAKNRIIECYLQTMEVESHEARAECLAVILHGLKDIDKSGAIEESDKLSEVVRSDLVASIDELLLKTASHFDVVRAALGGITKYDIATAASVAERLNTQVARDSAFAHIVTTAVTELGSASDMPAIIDSLKRITNSDDRDDCVTSAIEASIRAGVAAQLFAGLLSLARCCESARSSCSAAIALLSIDDAPANEVLPELISKIRFGIASLTSDVQRVHVLFQASAALAKFDRTLACDFYDTAEEIRTTSRIASSASEMTMARVMSLLLRSSRALIKFNEFSDDYLARFIRLCNLLPDPVSRGAHLADLATKGWCEQHSDLAKKIFQNYCRPLLEEFEIGGDAYNDLAGLMFIPAFLTKGVQAFDLLTTLPDKAREDALYSTCITIVRKVTGADPWSGGHERAFVNLDEAEDVVRLIEEMHSDFGIYSSIRILTDALLSKRTKGKITAQQRLALRQKLDAIVLDRLPDVRNIKHEGYLIVSQARLGRLSDNGPLFWNRLRARASALGNVADRVLIMIEIAECLPPKLSSEKHDLLQQGKDAIAQIPSAYDRFNRLNSLIDSARDTEPTTARAALREALDITFELDSESAAAKSRRSLLDMADQIDPKIVDTLINAIDDDPARARAKAELKEQAKVQRVRRKISDARSVPDNSDKSATVLPSAAWKNVGSLVCGRSEPLMPELLTEYVAASGEWDLHNAFPVLSWYIENLGRRFMRAEDVAAKISPVWESLLLSAELAINVIGKTTSKQTRLVFEAGDGSGDGVLAVRGDGRDEALDLMRLWLRELCERKEPILLCDPYFGVSDIEFVRMVLAECPQKKLIVLTSKKSLGSSTGDDFSKAWSDLMDQDPPDVEIIAVSDVGDDRSPVHDRWLLIGQVGLRLGTSLGGFGARLSEISKIEPGRAAQISGELASYVAKERMVKGQRVNYTSFML